MPRHSLRLKILLCLPIFAAFAGCSDNASKHLKLADELTQQKLYPQAIVEYEVAARLAVESGHVEFVLCLLEMAEVEWEHELYFRERVLSHPLARFIPVWRVPPPKSEIRHRQRNLAA